MKAERPEIYKYHDYQSFLKDWLSYKKLSQSDFSIRNLAKAAGLASGYLPMVTSGKRSLSSPALAKLLPHLGLAPAEQSFLENLVTLGTTDSQEVRIQALERMQTFGKFQHHNSQDTEVYKYLTHWYYVAIREMALMPNFQNDAEWVQAQLNYSVSLKDVKQALSFLIENSYIEVGADGHMQPPPDKNLECSGGVYRVALGKFHREIFDLAARSIENTPSEERSIQGHTLPINQKSLAQAKAIVDEAIAKIRALGTAEKHGESVYHFEVALFPLARKKPTKKSREELK